MEEGSRRMNYNTGYSTKSEILRRDAILKRKQDNEEKVMKMYEAEKLDAASFVEWQHDQRLKVENERLRELEKRKTEFEESQDLHNKKILSKMEENQKLVKMQRRDKEEMEKLIHIEKLKQDKLKQNLAAVCNKFRICVTYSLGIEAAKRKYKNC